MRVEGPCDICGAPGVGVVPVVREGIVESVSRRCGEHGGPEALTPGVLAACRRVVSAYRGNDDIHDACAALARALGEE